MKKIIKKMDKKFLAGFIPLGAASLYFDGSKVAAIGAIMLGVGYLIWQVKHDA